MYVFPSVTAGNMMSGDSPSLRPAASFELQETIINASIAKVRNVSDKGVQFEPSDLSDETDFMPKAPSVKADQGTSKQKLCNSSQNNNEDDIIVDDRIPELETKLSTEKGTDVTEAVSEKQEEEPNCVVNCLYFVDQCCECVLL
ncbi:uncharacterized protein LOC124795079 isoform X2 [Schistocerca piceifrons]|uniref:uncharacterized protein LOC124795079 isoform X2 n=1 Tax=Schistocerca piceifrons TaxID=274613 RepID=UPI001F5F10F7|nr:uncharacterized protein LOC124795079 isoform X2 [Schistocerca piceifrons]